MIVVGQVAMMVRNLERRERRNSVHFELESSTDLEMPVELELELRVRRRAAVVAGVQFSVDIWWRW